MGACNHHQWLSHLALMALLAFGAASFAAAQGPMMHHHMANGTNSTNSTMGNVTLASTLAEQGDLSTLLAAVSACPPVLAAATNPFIAVTLFAPNNTAFENLLMDLNTTTDALFNNSNVLCPLLEYHIVPFLVPTSAITNVSQVLPTLLIGTNLTVQEDNNTVYVNNVAVDEANITAGRSLIHVIGEVLVAPLAPPPPPVYGAYPVYPPPYPPSPPPGPPPSIASVGSNIPDLSSLLDAIAECPDLEAAATNPNASITVFAPTNEAFAAALTELNTTVANLTSQGILCPLLKYHVAQGIIPAALGLTGNISVATLLPGANVTFDSINGTNYINTATIIVPDIYVAGSAIQVIDQVLMPPMDLLYGNGTNSTNSTNETNTTGMTGRAGTAGGNSGNGMKKVRRGFLFRRFL